MNVNDAVWVRLTQAGVDHLNSLQYPERPAVSLGALGDWSKWQLWELMRTFGPIMCNGCPPPFETDIKLAKPSGAALRLLQIASED